MMQTNYTPTTDVLKDDLPHERTSTINVLTILTFIGCGISYLSTLSALTTKNPATQMEELEEAREKVGEGFMGRWIDGSIEMAQKSYDYRWVTFASGLLFTTMCLIGAIKMRKMQKDGFPIYAIGEVAPLLLMVALLGINLVTGIMLGFGAIIALVFLLLYAGQRKYMH